MNFRLSPRSAATGVAAGGVDWLGGPHIAAATTRSRPAVPAGFGRPSRARPEGAAGNGFMSSSRARSRRPHKTTRCRD